MASFDLPDHLIETLSRVLNQLQQTLPQLPQAPDFSAPAFKWQDRQLKPIYTPKTFRLDDLKGIEAQKEKNRTKYLTVSARLSSKRYFAHGLTRHGKIFNCARAFNRIYG